MYVAAFFQDCGHDHGIIMFVVTCGLFPPRYQYWCYQFTLDIFSSCSNVCVQSSIYRYLSARILHDWLLCIVSTNNCVSGFVVLDWYQTCNLVFLFTFVLLCDFVLRAYRSSKLQFANELCNKFYPQILTFAWLQLSRVWRDNVGSDDTKLKFVSFQNMWV